MLWGTCQSKWHYLLNSNFPTFFFFFNSLSGCPIAAAEKLAMSQDKSQLDSPQTGQCLNQVHRYELPLMSLILCLCHAPTQWLCHPSCANSLWPNLCSQLPISSWEAGPVDQIITYRNILDPPDVSLKINLYAKVT